MLFPSRAETCNSFSESAIVLEMESLMPVPNGHTVDNNSATRAGVGRSQLRTTALKPETRRSQKP
jgi:hypothetical protein